MFNYLALGFYLLSISILLVTPEVSSGVSSIGPMVFMCPSVIELRLSAQTQKQPLESGQSTSLFWVWLE